MSRTLLPIKSVPCSFIPCSFNGAGSKAARLIRDEVAGFMERFAAVKDYSFADDQPMAAETTRKWLAELLSQRGSSSLAVIPAGDSGDEGSVLDQTEANEALHLFAKKKRRRPSVSCRRRSAAPRTSGPASAPA